MTQLAHGVIEGQQQLDQQPTEAQPIVKHPDVIALAQGILGSLLERMHLEARIEGRLDGDVVKLDVSGRDTALVIGRKGATLEALQLVTNKIVRRCWELDGGTERAPRVVIDTEGYRERRSQGLQVMALRLAAKVRSCGQTIAIMGMRAADRRIVHMALAGRDDVVTHSEDEGRARRLLVMPRGEGSR